MTDGVTDAARLVARLRERGETLAVAESLTGGLALGALTAVPGASDVVRGGIVAYATDLKAGLLGVDTGLLAAGGPVQAEVAEQMARGVARTCGATWGLATTGVAGPGPADGRPAGTVFVAVVRQPDVSVSQAVPGLVDRAAAGADRPAVRSLSVDAVIRLGLDALR